MTTHLNRLMIALFLAWTARYDSCGGGRLDEAGWRSIDEPTGYPMQLPGVGRSYRGSFAHIPEPEFVEDECSMSWEIVGAIGEVLSAFVVLASLPYIAIQVRDTKRASHRASRQERNGALSKVVIDTPELAEAIAKVHAVDGRNSIRQELKEIYSFTDTELEVYYYYLAFVWRSLEIDFLTLDHRDDVELAISRRLEQPPFRKFIDAIGPRFNPEFIAAVERKKLKVGAERAG